MKTGSKFSSFKSLDSETPFILSILPFILSILCISLS